LPTVDRYARLDKESVLRLFERASSYVSGRRVTVQRAEGPLEGVTAGLNADGFLVVRQDDGTDAVIIAGGVRAAGA
jgi:BirA family biotin operon repressor/biotin-[acetyl-CoA-carboxylase] ligase